MLNAFNHNFHADMIGMHEKNFDNSVSPTEHLYEPLFVHWAYVLEQLQRQRSQEWFSVGGRVYKVKISIRQG